MVELNTIYNEDCLEGMNRIPDGSVDMILCDLPYGTTECKWDNLIPFKPLWEHYARVIKPGGAIVLTSAQPFTSALVMSKPELFKYALVWRKSRIQHFAQAPYRFLTEHEDILIFSNGGTAKNAKVRMKYNPQGVEATDKEMPGSKARASHRPRKTDQKPYKQKKTGYPKSILEFKSVSKTSHPTQKPVELFEYLIKSFTDEGETVLDNCMGSGTTAIAAINTGRNYIGYELDTDYHRLAEERVANHVADTDEVADTGEKETIN